MKYTQPRRGSAGPFILVIILVAIVTALVTALLVNIFERKAERATPMFSWWRLGRTIRILKSGL